MRYFLLAALLSAQDSILDSPTGDLRQLVSLNSKSHFLIPSYRDLNAWRARQTRIRNQIVTAAGLNPMPGKTPLNPRRFGLTRRPGFTVEKISIETFPGLRLAGNLYLPELNRSKLPAILLPHGHWKQGRIHNAEDYSVPALAAGLAARGFAVLAYDMVGYNDTRQLPHNFGDNKLAMLWSFSPMGIQLWNSIRALDFLESLDEVDANRIGMTGTSGGGTQTLLLSAIDLRIRASAPGGMVSASFQGDDGCEEAPGLHIGLSSVEIAAAMAPRPILLVSATGDWTRNTPEEEYPAIQSIYALYNEAPLAENAHINAGHNCNRESRQAIYDFFDRCLRGAATGALDEPDVASLSPAELLLGTAKRPDREQAIFNEWKLMSMAQSSSLPLRELRMNLRSLLGLDENRIRVVAIPAGDRLLLEHVQSGDRIAVWWQPAPGKMTSVLVHSAGMQAAVDSLTARQLRARGHSLLFVQVFRSTASTAAATQTRHQLCFRRTDDANRVRDIIFALRFAAQGNPASGMATNLVCLGESGPWCLAAAAASLDRVSLFADATAINDNPSSLARRLFIPGLARIGGAASLRRLVSLKE